MSSTPLKIKFNYHPYKIEDKEHAVEKADASGSKRRYLRGISSGVRQDGADERMTPECIKSFSDQANSGQILLYPDVHGIKSTEDIGILCHHEITPQQDWLTEYRLYDQMDLDPNIHANKLATIDTIWKQANGLPPYKQPVQKGFSIEGDIPDGGLVSYDEDSFGNVSRRVMNAVTLQGVVLVPRPAYQDSIAHAVYKALGEHGPWAVNKVVEKAFDECRDSVTSYHTGRYKLEDALYKSIESIMSSTNADKVYALEHAFAVHKEQMMALVEKDSNSFVVCDTLPNIKESSVDNLSVLKGIHDNLNRLLLSKSNESGVHQC